MTQPQPISASATDWFESTELLRCFHSIFGRTQLKGLDRVSGKAFGKTANSEATVASRLIAAKQYRFAPYLEKLVSKGRSKHPRVISIPTLRDRIVLHQLKVALHELLPAAVPQELPSTTVRRVKSFLSQGHPPAAFVFRTDLENFYPSIVHDRLIEGLRASGVPSHVTELVRRAIKTPTISAGPRARRLRRETLGVPQGLSISNVLANFYAMEIDRLVGGIHLQYIRYVDDILVLVDSVKGAQVQQDIEAAAHSCGLTLNRDKTVLVPYPGYFDFLGYRFSPTGITVRPQSVHRFLTKIAGTLSWYRSRVEGALAPPWTVPSLRQAILREELNERITGALSENRRYGWLNYYSEITDETLLHRLDAEIRRMASRIPEFSQSMNALPLKTLSRTWYETRFSPRSGYIQDYNLIVSTQDMLDYLLGRALISAAEAASLSSAEVTARFEKERARKLADLGRDIGFVS